MIPIPRVRFSMGSISMFVVTAAAGSALFEKLMEHSRTGVTPTWKYDSPTLVVLAIALTAIALGALKSHSAVQTMLQATVAFLGYFSLISIAESGHLRVLLYWFQSAFAATVALPLVARKVVKEQMPRGPRRNWWKKTCEALVFAFFNIMLVALGAFIQWVMFALGKQILNLP